MDTTEPARAKPVPTNDIRVYFAAERTLLAWIRTGIALMAFGFVVARFGLFLRELMALHPDLTPADFSLSAWLGPALVGVGTLLNLAAAAEHVRFLRAFHSASEYQPPRVPTGVLLAVLLSAAGVAVAGYLLVGP